MVHRMKVGLLAASAAVVVASCSSGGGNVTGNNPLNPTPVPSGFVASPSPVASSASTTPVSSPSATSTGSTSAPTPSPTPTPTTQGATPGPTATATSVATTAATPTAMATSTSTSGLSSTCSPSSATYSTMQYTLPGSAETIQLPNYPSTSPYQITGSSMLPSQTAGSVLTVDISQNSFVPAGQTSSGFQPSKSSVILYSALEVSESTTFGSGSTSTLIPVTINSPCVTSGTTYTEDEASGGLDVYTETDTASSNGTITGHIETALNPFPASTYVYITLSH